MAECEGWLHIFALELVFIALCDEEAIPGHAPNYFPRSLWLFEIIKVSRQDIRNGIGACYE